MSVSSISATPRALVHSPTAGRLGRYIAGRVVGWTLGLFAVGLGLILLIDVIEMLRRTGDLDDATALDAMTVSALRLPWLGEQLLPFAVLFGAIVSLLGLSRKLELVVARAAGVSVWGFLRLPAIAIFALGIVFVGVYNPVSAIMKTKADALEAEIFSAFRTQSASLWLRQEGGGGGSRSIVRTAGVTDEGRRLIRPTFYVLGENGVLARRVEAEEAVLRDGAWEARGAWVSAASDAPRFEAVHAVATGLSAEDVRETLADGLTASFWSLPGAVDRARAAGLPAYRLRLEHQSLLARPFLLTAMLVIAACVSLGLARSGGVARTVVGGIAAGFGLYIVTKLAADLGSAGLIFAPLAAWSPPLLGLMLGAWVLLKREDG